MKFSSCLPFVWVLFPTSLLGTEMEGQEERGREGEGGGGKRDREGQRERRG